MRFLRTMMLYTLPFLIVFENPVISIASTQTSGVAVPAGLPVILQFAEEVSAKKAIPGQSVKVVVMQDVVVQGITVIRAGTLANARVATSQKPSALGSPGRISVIIDSVPAVDGTPIALINSYSNAEGKSQVVEALIVAIICCILGLLIQGKDGVIQANTQVIGTTGANTTVVV